jgi:tRNA(Ile)-lysidine synthase
VQAVFPHVRDTFARTAAHAAQAQELLRELADTDLVQTRHASGDGLVIKQVQYLSRARQANLLRYWLKVRFTTQASAAQLNELLDQIAVCTTRAHKINIKLGEGFAVRQDEFLTWYNP